MSLKDVGFDLAKGLRGLRRVGFWVSGWVGGWICFGRIMAEDAGVVAMEVAEPQQPAQADRQSEGEREDGYFPNNISQVVLGLRNTDPLRLHMLLPAHRDIIDTSMSVCLPPTPWSSSSSRNFVFL